VIVERFTTLEAVACPLGLANVDTDQLIPARFMSRSRGQGYGSYLLHDLRFDAGGAPLPDFILNAPRYAGARILVAGRNFGTGSSREAAVYALWDYGIRCVIAPSFGDIFASNAVKNGLLPAVVDEAAVEALLRDLATSPPVLQVDLATRSIRIDARQFAFGVDPVRRLQLLNGWDDIDLTLRHAEQIASYRRQRIAAEPWILPAPPGVSRYGISMKRPAP
jgi:3-isopropylmalate/(R)-2-methylmalate dehydratase small subunit